MDSDHDPIHTIDGETYNDLDDDGFNVVINQADPSIEKCYVILKEDDLIQRLKQDINKVTSVLSINKDYACMLLIRYNWSVRVLHETWFEDEVKVRETVGLLDVDPNVKFPKTFKKLVDCGICFDSVREYDSATCGCGHYFCKVCWKGYVCTAINDGPGCLSLRCPEPNCGAAVGPDMVNVFVEDKERKRYERFVFMSYVESNKKIKWCPGPGCEYAVEFDDDLGTGSYDVYCVCKYGFCWKCSEDAHRPLDCETVAKWMLKNMAEAKNTNWILAFTKPCPKCKRPIEKNAGCMFMTCGAPCHYRFCWFCLGPTIGHDSRACNGYIISRLVGVVNDTEKQREMAKKAIERYTHYYERWAANEKSRKKALSDLHKFETVYVKKLSLSYGHPERQLRFIVDAWLQIVDCRRVLKWTYAYGYYIPENEEGKKSLLEYLQGEAETGLERLHQCAEKELKTYIPSAKDEDTKKPFNEFKNKLVHLTLVTGSYFENLVRALKNGLPEVWLDEKAWNADYILEETDLFI